MSLQPTSKPRAPRPGSAGASEIQLARTPAVSDDELVRRALAGNWWAEEAIYRRYAPMILGTARRLLADGEEAQDVTQETFSTAFAMWAQLREPARLKQWLMQIAISKVHRRFRRKRLLRALGLESSLDDATLDTLALPSCSPEVRAELFLLSRALDRVSVAARIAWMLRHVEGLSLDEIAEECSCSLATVKRRIGTAEKRLEVFVSRSRP